MWTITLGDLRYRAARFVVAVLGAAVVFALALLLSGLSAAFRTEIRTTVDDARADRWIVARGTTGPLTGFKILPADMASQITGAEAVDPLLSAAQAAQFKGAALTVNLFGHRLGGLGTPEVVDGRSASRSHEAVVDELLGASIGDRVTVAGTDFTVVGITHNHRMYAGSPNIYASIDDVRAALVSGAPVVTSFLTRGIPETLPAGLKAMTNEDVFDDTLRVMGNALDSVDVNRILMWLVAVLIVAALVYITALERTRDFAVLKAMGARSSLPVASLVVQSIIVTLVAGLVAVLISGFLKPLFPLPIAVPLHAYRDLVAVSVIVGGFASLAGARRAVTVDPSLAFGGA
jgi:putative ABC transport system permease protein